jgi:DNA invertase Pin-like site-specific DNA recombinase
MNQNYKNDFIITEIRFISLDLPYSTDMAVNQLISKFGTIATFENERWKDRQRQGNQAAKKKWGNIFGRKLWLIKN